MPSLFTDQRPPDVAISAFNNFLGGDRGVVNHLLQIDRKIKLAMPCIPLDGQDGDGPSKALPPNIPKKTGLVYHALTNGRKKGRGGISISADHTHPVPSSRGRGRLLNLLLPPGIGFSSPPR